MLHSATTSIVKILNWVSRQRPRIQLDTLAQISFRFLSFTTMALLLEDMDLNVNAGDDFYSFANGGWLAANPSPPAEFTRYGTFETAAEEARDNLKLIAEEETSKPPGQSQVGDMYASAMDEQLSESVGLSPLYELQQQINAVGSASDLMRLSASLHEISSYPCFNLSAEPDSKNSRWTLLHLYQGGLGLPDRDYYVLDEHRELLGKYEAHLVQVFTAVAAGCAAAAPADPAEAAKHVIHLETELAKASLTRVERRDPEVTYNKMSVGELPGGAELWMPYLDTAMLSPISDLGDVIIDSIGFFSRLAELVKDSSLLKNWNSYLHWHLIKSASPYLTRQLDDLSFQFYGRTLSGQKEQKPRWKRVLAVIGRELETPLGQIYVERHFSSAAKSQCLEMVELLRESLRERIKELEWMSDSTKVKALEKLDAFRVKIGFPDKWEDFSNVKVMRSLSYIENKWIGDRAQWARERARINKPVDIDRWEMPPQMVNAYFHPQLNEIVFPAAILQPPFFIPPSDLNPLGDPAVSLGGIGAVIGHEMTHGYDDAGRKFNAEGNLVDWWTTEDATSFAERASVIIDQFQQYQVEGKHLNGKLTQGENIADLGGVKLAYTALKKFWARSGNGEPALLDGFTTYQRFFLSWARVWRNTICKEEAIKRVVVDPHSPGKYRVNGPLVHLSEFHEAFNVCVTDAMFAPEEKRCLIW